jgi:hypothetical protein
MVSDHTSAPSLKVGIIPASTTPVTDSYPLSLKVDSLPLPVSGHPYHLIPAHAAVRGATSSDHHSSIDENDIVIAYVFLELTFIALILRSTRVMGLTGAGKSSVSFRCETPHPIRLRHSQFVNTAAGRTEVVVGDDLKSRTRTVQPIRCLHPDGRRNIVLVDTPGFDDINISDSQILRIIANWLKET